MIGTLAKMGPSDALFALDAASEAWDSGQGTWPQMSLKQRIAAIEAVVEELKYVHPSISQSVRGEG